MTVDDLRIIRNTRKGPAFVLVGKTPFYERAAMEEFAGRQKR